MKVVLRDTLTTYWRGQIQYNRGQYLEVYNTGLYDKNMKFQFLVEGVAQHDQLGELINNEYYKVKIPDDLLKQEDEIKCFVYRETEDTAETKKIIIIDVMGRENYNPTPTEEEKSLIGELLDKVNNLQENLENFVLSDEQREAIAAQVIEEAKKELNFDNYYTKKEVDEIKQNIWYPTITEEGTINWEKSLTDEAPTPVNVKGEKGDKGDPGEKGEPGENGKDGQDYILTDDDKTEITNNLKAYVDEAILGGEF